MSVIVVLSAKKTFKNILNGPSKLPGPSRNGPPASFSFLAVSGPGTSFFILKELPIGATQTILLFELAYQDC